MVETVELSILDALWSLQGLRIEKEGCREETKEKEKRGREQATERNERMGEGRERQRQMSLH